MVNKIEIKVFRIGNSKAVYLPSSLRNDSSYPFNEEEEKSLVMEIRGKTIIIKLQKNEN